MAGFYSAREAYKAITKPGISNEEYNELYDYIAQHAANCQYLKENKKRPVEKVEEVSEKTDKKKKKKDKKKSAVEKLQPKVVKGNKTTTLGG